MYVKVPHTRILSYCFSVTTAGTMQLMPMFENILVNAKHVDICLDLNPAEKYSHHLQIEILKRWYVLITSI